MLLYKREEQGVYVGTKEVGFVSNSRCGRGAASVVYFVDLKSNSA